MINLTNLCLDIPKLYINYYIHYQTKEHIPLGYDSKNKIPLISIISNKEADIESLINRLQETITLILYFSIYNNCNYT